MKNDRWWECTHDAVWPPQLPLALPGNTNRSLLACNCWLMLKYARNAMLLVWSRRPDLTLELTKKLQTHQIMWAGWEQEKVWTVSVQCYQSAETPSDGPERGKQMFNRQRCKKKCKWLQNQSITIQQTKLTLNVGRFSWKKKCLSLQILAICVCILTWFCFSEMSNITKLQ